jgi:hypothetical protein
MKFLYVFLFSVSIFAQNKIIDVKINAITHDDSDYKKRVYTINYQIENLTNNPVSFFLTPNTLIANAASSMTLFTIYKIYINGVFTPLDGPFFEKEGIDWLTKLRGFKDYTTPEAKEIIKKALEEFEEQNKLIVANYKKGGGKNTDEFWILKNQHLLDSKITLNPKEIKQFVITTNWNKERYFKEDDLEYYLDEKDKYEFEMTLSLQKDNFKSRLSEDEFQKIEKDINFIQGNFISNKIDINLK